MARSPVPDSIPEPFLCRPFFVHDYDDRVMSLLFEVRGRGTALLAEERQEMLVSAPLGRGFVADSSGPVALVGGGVWVSPLKFLSRELDAAGVSRDMYLEVPEDAPEAYAVWISENYPGADLILTNGDGSRDLIERIGDLSRFRVLYVSGTSETLTAAKHASDGVVPAQLAVRERMACASGSCHGCAVPVWRGGELNYARACIEGPVFEAETLAW